METMKKEKPPSTVESELKYTERAPEVHLLRTLGAHYIAQFVDW